LNNFQLISGGRISIEHLLLTSSSAILFGFGPGLDNAKCQHSGKPDALAAILSEHAKIHSNFYFDNIHFDKLQR
jgi:hypothetical protein